jgi:predicted phage baseplate assembly protein
MPRTLRHRDRAVTLEDYEDLARLASSEVARALCVPLRDLLADPLGEVPQPGAVSVVVVPRTSDVKPLPTMELLESVGAFLAARAAATASFAVVGPLYLRVDVRADIAVASADRASAVERAVYEKLAAFLHPLTGGLDGSGWDFGRAPHRSDFFALIETVPGVDHVRYLQITETEDRSGVRRTGRFLVFSGQHQIDLAFEET